MGNKPLYPINRRLFSIASVLMGLTGVLHFVSLFAKAKLDTPEKEQMHELMYNYQFDWGIGIMRSMSEIHTAISLYFAALLVGFAFYNKIVLKHAQNKVVMHAITLNFIIITIMLIVTYWKAFIIPMILMTLCWTFIAICFFRQLSKPVED